MTPRSFNATFQRSRRYLALRVTLILVFGAACSCQPEEAPATGVTIEPVNTTPPEGANAQEVADFLKERGAYLRCHESDPPEQAGNVTNMASIAGTDYVIQAVATGPPCDYTLALGQAPPEGADDGPGVAGVPIPVPPSVYLHVSGVTHESGQLIIAMNALDATFSPVPDSPDFETFAPTNARIDAIAYDTTQNTWGPVATLVAPTEKAIWLAGVTSVEGQPVVQYGLDSLYEMLFFNMAGRDATDGRYSLPVKVSGSELIAEEPV
jgi:hypothetical protein